MRAACGVEYPEAQALVDVVEIDGVPIPFASAELLWRTKDTIRAKDQLDRVFLASLLRKDRP
jgi:hypothetical protein